MQELTTAPQTTSPYTPAGGSNMPALTAAQPKLGTPIPGTTGGLAAKPGLTVYDNPLSQQLQSNPQQSAQQAQSYGRGEDTMLIHMTPEEVNSLQGLAMAHGGSLTINPHTGLPEAGWLGKLLPTVLGAVGMAFGIPPVWMGLLGAAGGTAATGSLSKGLMMGLGAFGGASLGGAIGIGGKLGQVGAGLGLPGSSAAVMHPAASATQGALDKVINQGLQSGVTMNAPNAAFQQVATAAGNQLAPASGMMGNFSQAASAGLPGGIAAKAAPMAAGLGLLNTVTPSVKTYEDKNKPSEYGYTGPYSVAGDRVLQTEPTGVNDIGIATTPEGKMTSKEQLYYKPTTSYVDSSGKAWTPGEKTTPVTNVGSSKKPKWVYDSELGAYEEQKSLPFWMAEGGEVFHMESGGHVFPAKAVAAYGNFDTEAGQEKLAKLGGIPIKGPGDGVSDSIRAKIDGAQDARVATGEVYFPPKAVKKLGGNEKLYAMMRKAERAANRTKSGEKVKGLGAL